MTTLDWLGRKTSTQTNKQNIIQFNEPQREETYTRMRYFHSGYAKIDRKFPIKFYLPVWCTVKIVIQACGVLWRLYYQKFPIKLRLPVWCTVKVVLQSYGVLWRLYYRRMVYCEDCTIRNFRSNFAYPYGVLWRLYYSRMVYCENCTTGVWCTVKILLLEITDQTSPTRMVYCENCTTGVWRGVWRGRVFNLWLSLFWSHALKPQWLEHPWDHENSFETLVVRFSDG